MADNKQGTASRAFLIEMDGVSAAQASEVSGLGVKHEPFKINVGGRANPIIGRSGYEGEEVTVKHAYALGSTGQEMFSWFGDYIRGDRTDKLSFRLIQLAENGYSTENVWDLSECVPTAFMHEGAKADSNDAAYFTLKFKPTDVDFN